jgi:ketosteroid isomerase-like protein
MNRTIFFVTLLASMLALAVSTPAPAKDNPASLAQRHAAAIAHGDVAAALAMYTDDAVLRAGPLCTATACVGKAAIQKELERRVADKVRATIISKYMSGNIAAVRAEVRSDTIQKAGVDRIITWTIYEAKGDKLVAATGEPQHTDTQTAKFLEWQRSQPPAR